MPHGLAILARELPRDPAALLPVVRELRQHGSRATVFLPPGAISCDRTRTLLEAEGHEVGLLGTLDDVHALAASGKGVPSGFVHQRYLRSRPPVEWFASLIRCGIAYDCSILIRPLGSLRDLPPTPFRLRVGAQEILEWPPLNVRCYWERVPLGTPRGFRLTPAWYLLERLMREEEKGRAGMLQVALSDLCPDRRVRSQVRCHWCRRKLELLAANVCFRPAGVLLRQPGRELEAVTLPIDGLPWSISEMGEPRSRPKAG